MTGCTKIGAIRQAPFRIIVLFLYYYPGLETREDVDNALENNCFADPNRLLVAAATTVR